MGDKTGIEWTDATTIDRGGRRVRVYCRKDSSRPGQQMRRQMLLHGLKWCRDCGLWLQATSVGKNGLCRPHENAQARSLYASDSTFRASRRQHAHARKRGVSPMPGPAQELILDIFDGRCGYCGRPHESWDHALAVSRGGATEPGNMVPCCRSCNSRKKDMELSEWIAKAPSLLPYTIEYLTFAGHLQ